MFEDSNDSWDRLAAMLREELAGYGELFSILESQREFLLSQDLDAFIGANQELERQAGRIQDMRDRRGNFIDQFSAAIGWEDSTPPTIKILVCSAPDKLRPMFAGLIEEVERLMRATRDYLKRNQMLVRRAYDTNRQFIAAISNEGSTTTGYRRNGVLEKPRNHAMATTYLARA
ncbi:MAG: flagellar protein FlgN [Opitutales bacterium]